MPENESPQPVRTRTVQATTEEAHFQWVRGVEAVSRVTGVATNRVASAPDHGSHRVHQLLAWWLTVGLEEPVYRVAHWLKIPDQETRALIKQAELYGPGDPVFSGWMSRLRETLPICPDRDHTESLNPWRKNVHRNPEHHPQNRIHSPVDDPSYGATSTQPVGL